MHPMTVIDLAKSHINDLEAEAAGARTKDVRPHESDELRPTRWGIRLPHLVPPFRRGPAPTAGTA